jgi:hypothetical protein
MSNSLKFTLKQLLDLGIICSHKKKKRRDTSGKSSVISGVNQVAPSRISYLPSQSQSFPPQVNPYADPFDPNRYTYAVRLREEEDRKLIRKLQEKQQQQAFQSAVKENFRRLDIQGRNDIMRDNYAQPEEDIYGDVGYAREDMNGYFGRTANDDEFKSQQVGGFAEGEDAGYFSAREDFGMSPEEMPQEEGFDPEQLPPETVRYKAVRRSADFYRNLYEELAGASADPNILKSKKAQPIKSAYIKLLIKDYRELGGAERDILKSQNIDLIRGEISKMMTGKKSS